MTDTPATAFGSHTPDIKPPGFVWTAWQRGGAVPAWVIDDAGTGLNPEDSGDGNFRGFYGNVGQADVRIIVEFKSNAINPSWPAVIARWTSNVDMFTIWWNAESNTIFLDNPSETTLASASLALDPSDLARITVTLVGDSIEALFENLTQSLSATLSATSSSQQLAPRHGMGCRTAFGAGAADVFDNFRIETP